MAAPETELETKGPFSLNDYIKETYGSMSMSSSGGREGGDFTCIPVIDDDTSLDRTYSTGSSENGDDYSRNWTLRRLALELSLYLNLLITFAKLVAYVRTLSLSVLAALLDSVLDVVSQVILNYTERRSGMQRSSAFYPAGASRLEPIGVLTCAALMGMASFEVIKESSETLIFKTATLEELTMDKAFFSFWSIVAIVFIKLMLLALCQKASHRRRDYGSSKAVMQLADPTLEALAQDHWNDALSNGVAAMSLLFALYSPSLWWIDPVGAIVISLYIIYSWYHTGREQIEQLTGTYCSRIHNIPRTGDWNV
jgi:cation diffusion facilitator family transporter